MYTGFRKKLTHISSMHETADIPIFEEKLRGPSK